MVYCTWFYSPSGASLVAQMVKNLSAMRKTWVQSLSGEDLLQKGMTTHSSILAWRIPWTEKPGGLLPIGSQELDMTEQHFHFFLFCIPNTYVVVPG